MLALDTKRSLILANLATISMALVFQWPTGLLLWPYWIQSVIIGWFSRRRILALQDFSTDGLKVNDQPVEPTLHTQRRTANFFALHYGLFHFAYAIFLWPGSKPLSTLDWLGIAVSALTFAANHRHSFQRNVEADAAGKPNIGTLMFLPYARIVPMHLAILLGGAIAGGAAHSPITTLLFGGLKTAADVAMHVLEHRILQRTLVNQPKP